MRVAFAGTPEFADKILRSLLGSEHEVGLVISQPNSRRGRRRKTVLTPVAKLAEEKDLTLRQPDRIGELAGEISHHDALVVAAYGQILRADTLYAAQHDAYNVHASLLPAYRGAAPIERALIAGEKKTGVSIMRMNEGLDTGPVTIRRGIPIPPDMNAGELTERLANVGGEAIVEALKKVEDGSTELREQDASEATYAAKISSEDRDIHWDGAAGEIKDHIRALSPHIGARAVHPDFNGPIKVLRSKVAPRNGHHLSAGEIEVVGGQIFVGCGVGVLEIEKLQAPGGRPLQAEDFLRGNSFGGTFDY